MNGNVKRASIAGLVTASMLGGVVIGAIAFGGTSALAASSSGTSSNDHTALIQNEAVIDFSRHNDARVTIKLSLSNAPASASTADFTVQVIITDTRIGTLYDSGPNAPTAVR
jgi:hypothetical protein